MEAHEVIEACEQLGLDMSAARSFNRSIRPSIADLFGEAKTRLDTARREYEELRDELLMSDTRTGQRWIVEVTERSTQSLDVDALIRRVGVEAVNACRNERVIKVVRAYRR